VRRINDPDLVAREYDSTERLVARRLDRTAWLHGTDEPWRVALQAVAEARPTSVLDAGCGNGDFAATIAAPEVVCLDSSPAAVEAARRRGLRAELGRIEELPFPDGAFDVVTSNWALYHLPDPDAGVAEIARALRPGGRFVGMYNHSDHLAEVWRLVADPVWDEDPFGCETGLPVLRRHFARVERREAVGRARWDTREALQSFLDSFAELVGPLQAPAGAYPLEATRRNCVLVADR
jgi:SAM-dependent methyltransferase